jgi:serine/threonine-protein kinase
MLLCWLAVVLIITGLAAVAGWTIGSNLSGLI